MILKLQYETIDERKKIISDNANLVLIEEQNIKEGNFLIFSDTVPQKEIIYTNIPEGKIEQLEMENSFVVLEMLKAQEQAASAEQANADLTLELIVKGVL